MDWSVIICAALSLVGTGLGSFSGFKLASYRIEQLEKKVEKHNGFAERIPILEYRLKELEDRLNAND